MQLTIDESDLLNASAGAAIDLERKLCRGRDLSAGEMQALIWDHLRIFSSTPTVPAEPVPAEVPAARRAG